MESSDAESEPVDLSPPKSSGLASPFISRHPTSGDLL